MNESSCTVRSPGDHVRILDLPRVLSEDAEPAVEAAYGEAADEGVRRILLNFSEVERAEGLLLFLLTRLCTRSEKEGRELGVFGLGGRCWSVLADLDFLEFLDFFPSETEALTREGIDLPPRAAPGAASEVCPPDLWAGPLGRARAPKAPEDLLVLNVEGRRARGPLRGFGPLWEKRYWLSLGSAEVDPRHVGRLLREELSRFLPAGNRIYLPSPGAVPGAVGAMELRLPGEFLVPTGIRVVYADDTSFTFVPLEGAVEAAFIHLGVTAAGDAVRVRLLFRTGDPLWEMGFTVFGHDAQDRFWRSTLEALGEELGVGGEIRAERNRLDGNPRWDKVGNVSRNAALRTGVALAGALFRQALRRAVGP